jgi:hypothetical protein
MRTGSRILLLHTLAEFSSVAIRKAKIEVDAVPTTIDLGERCCLGKALRMRPFRCHLAEVI